MNRSDIDDTLRDMWATRPRRYKSDRKIAGVAAAIARRYQISPTLVRIGFVAAAIYGGAGIVLYLFGWLLLPGENDEVSPAEAALGRGRSSMSRALTWVLGIALIPISIGMLSDDLSTLIIVVLIATGLFLLHQHRGDLGQDAGVPAAPGDLPASDQPTVAGPFAAAAGGTASEAAAPATPEQATRPTDQVWSTQPSHLADQTRPTDPTRPTDRASEAPTPPAWDPLGAAPFAWDLPEPAQDEPPPRRSRRRSAVTPLTIGLALVTAGVGAFAAMYDSYLDGPRVLAMVLAVLGGGLVVGSFVRGGRGLIPIVIPLAVITWAIAVSPPHGWDGFGDQKYTPTAVADVRQSYELGAGKIELDLTGLPLTDGDAVPPVRVRVGAGDVMVIVPENADVKATCSAGFGTVKCLDQTSDGPDIELPVTDNGHDGPGGGALELNLSAGTGNVELKRG
jgi:phage shock protein PspC (stress-responsive transcriptional regulator)/predicted membrane protein